MRDVMGGGGVELEKMEEGERREEEGGAPVVGCVVAVIIRGVVDVVIGVGA